MNAALCALHEVVARTPQPYKNLIPSFVSILKQARLACHTSLSAHVKQGSQHGLQLAGLTHINLQSLCTDDMCI